MTAREVFLEGGSPWGFRMNGGADLSHALRISRVNPGSKAAQKGVREGDVISSINGQTTKCLTNGESHALLRTVGETLRLGLNQDTSGSPKRRKEPLKREASSSSTQSTPSTPVPVDAAPSAASESASTPSDQSEPTSAGAKVFVCGIWHSVSKVKHRGRNGVNQGKSATTEQQSLPETSHDPVSKASSSKARRIRRLKLKSAKREELAAQEENTPDVAEHNSDNMKKPESACEDHEEEDKVEVGVKKASEIESMEESYISESNSDRKDKTAVIVEVIENNTSMATKSKTKKNNKSKGFSLSQIFTSKTTKSHNIIEECSIEIKENVVPVPLASERKQKEISNVNYTQIRSSSAGITADESERKIMSETNCENIKDNDVLHSTTDTTLIKASPPKNKLHKACINSTPLINPSTNITQIENETKYKTDSLNSTSSALKINKPETMHPNEITKHTHTCKETSNSIMEEYLTDDNMDQQNTILNASVNDDVKSVCNEDTEIPSRPISIFVVPPDNIAEESEAPGVDWESVSDFETKSQSKSSDEDEIRPETLVHLPANDLKASVRVIDGKNVIVQNDDYDLSVIDLYSPIMAPEEEARLRCFLETLNLTKPEEYDDTSSSKSFGDSSSTSISESSPIPPPASDEIVVYRHVKTHSVAEPCYIPPKHQRHLDVITEETSDPSDSEKKNGTNNPWESSELIRKNNEMESIPNDWYGSDEEPGTTSDEGGIDTSWGEGKKLEEIEGVEIVYLSDDSSAEESLNKPMEDNHMDVRNEKNLPELVVVHTIERGDTKNTVKLRHPDKNNDLYKEDEIKSKKIAMDEIVAILDSTYEVNKDIFMKQSSDINLDKKISKSKDISHLEGLCESKYIENKKLRKSEPDELNNIIQDPLSIYTTHTESSTILDIFDSVKYDTYRLSVDKNSNENFTDNFPEAQESLMAVTPPTLSRQGSSSSATSQSTARFNPEQSPVSSETEDKPENECSSNKKTVKKLYNPKTLKYLSKDMVKRFPHGDFNLKNIGLGEHDVVAESEGFEVNTDKIINSKLKSLPPSGVSTRRSSFHELENIYSLSHRYNDKEASPPRPVLISSPPSSITSLPNDDPWVGLPTSTDPRLLVCLSPSQSKDSFMTSPKEATELLELHKKFLERRGYHETNNRNPIYSPKSDRSRTPDFSSPDLIKLEPYASNKAQVYTPELLIEAANLLALKEYRQSRFKSGTQSDSFKTPETTTSVTINGNVLEKNDGLSEMTSLRAEITTDSEDPDPNRSAGTSRLLALLQDSGVPCSSPNSTVPLQMARVDKSDVKKPDRMNKYTGSYISEWLTMTENVTSRVDIISKTDFNENVINLNICANGSESNSNNNPGKGSFVEKRHFEADKYKISKQGDIAIIQSTEDHAKRPSVRNERPKSLPATGVPALTPSGGELFREQMYHEYMDKVAERTERRQKKEIKISSRPSSMYSKIEPEGEKLSQNSPAINKLESEFMNKVRERMSKLGIDLESDQTDETAEETSAKVPLPKHLQEFIELTTAPQAEAAPDAPTGVWSPGATPEPQRKELNFSAVKEEVVQEDTEPVPPVWTPKSAQASPTLERKSFRPVNFESPKLSRKTYNQKPPEEEPKPPTDLPLPLDSPSHSQASSVSSSTQYLSTTRETVTTSTQESSGRLVTSHSLPDTSLDNKLPRAQNPTITLLQKAREGQIPKGAQYLDQNTSDFNDKRSSPPAVRPNEILYSVRKEYESETEDKRPKKIVELTPRKFDGIGPVTKEGIPIVLRSEVQDENQQKWYKRMYDSLHRAERDKEYLTVRYKTRRGRYPYTSPGGYLSEPEPLGGYDSDYTTAKYATLDRRRIRNKENDFTTSTMPRSKYNAVKHGVDIYKNQPGRIEDYEPGHSSIADKETKQWWDEVMDIFDGQFEQTQKSSSRTHAPTTTSTTKPFMTYALKESGYESDSTLVFKRRDETQQELSPAEQKLAYKIIQKGGDVPIHGLRKPVPEKPKESPHRYVESEVTIHYRSPVRNEEKEVWSEEELQRRQAEAMRRIYQEERRRKYLQELQDMYSRRHTDNFTPSQKSPIPLNRYDDFVDDLSPGKPRDRTPEPKLVARALYNFIGQTSRELTFRRGDIIYVRRQIDKNWYEGEHNAMIGLFPFNYVEIIPYDGIRTIPKRPTEGQARAKFNFQAQTHLELPLVKGELVLLTRRVDNNWFEGRIGNRKGIFPVSYVEVLVEPGERAMSPVRVNTPTKPVASPASHSLHVGNNMSQHHYQPPRPVSYTSLPRQKTADLKHPPVNQTLHIDTQNEPVPYRVLYNYKPQNEDELELVEGETVYVMEKCDDGWYVGSSQRTGYLGTFPGNYVERIV